MFFAVFWTVCALVTASLVVGVAILVKRRDAFPPFRNVVGDWGLVFVLSALFIWIPWIAVAGLWLVVSKLAGWELLANAEKDIGLWASLALSFGINVVWFGRVIILSTWTRKR